MRERETESKREGEREGGRGRGREGGLVVGMVRRRAGEYNLLRYTICQHFRCTISIRLSPHQGRRGTPGEDSVVLKLCNAEC